MICSNKITNLANIKKNIKFKLVVLKNCFLGERIQTKKICVIKKEKKN